MQLANRHAGPRTGSGRKENPTRPWTGGRFADSPKFRPGKLGLFDMVSNTATGLSAHLLHRCGGRSPFATGHVQHLFLLSARRDDVQRPACRHVVLQKTAGRASVESLAYLLEARPPPMKLHRSFKIRAPDSIGSEDQSPQARLRIVWVRSFQGMELPTSNT